VSDITQATEETKETGFSTGRPEVVVIGRDGNAFSILGACKQAAIRSGAPSSEVSAFLAEAMSADYDHLLATVQKWFDVR
jgi:hypothetical protein